jgi:hypothetical protein
VRTRRGASNTNGHPGAHATLQGDGVGRARAAGLRGHGHEAGVVDPGPNHPARLLPLPRSLPFAHAERVLHADGGLVEQSDWAAKVAAFVPWSLNELVLHSAALKPLRAA